MNFQRAFDCASERLEHALSTWLGVLVYLALCGLTFALWGWDGIDRFVYLTGAIIIVLLIGAGRRDSKAAQAKLDALTPDDTLNRLEERQERDIERLRG